MMMMNQQPNRIRSTHPTTTNNNNNNTGLLALIALFTFSFCLLKIPLEMKVLARAAPPHMSIDDFYNQKEATKSHIQQRIDAKRSFHFFNRREPSVGGRHLPTKKEARAEEEDEEFAQEVVRMMQHDRQNLRRWNEEHHRRTFSERAKQLVETYLYNVHADSDLDDPDRQHNHKKKQYDKKEDPFDKEEKTKVQDIVNHYSDPEEI